jgi:rfaE bifunctional protein kinase chain/domain
MKVLVIGETIIDEYHFCDVMGKAGKEPVLAARFKHAEQYAGGILAIANHLSNFCDHVGLVSAVGADESHEHFIRARLHKNVRAHFAHVPGVPTIVKRRFLEEYLAAKLFEVYIMRGEHLDPESEAQLGKHLETILPDYDAVIVADFGHGLMTERLRKLVCESAKFLAVNTQTNAGNRGFNLISKYSRADYVSIGDPEIRLECRDMTGDMEPMMTRVAQRMNARAFLVTRGRSGCLCYDAQSGIHAIPAFSIRVVDRIGAGDAVLAVTAPCVARGTPTEVVGFIANVVGAEACMIMGNKTSIDPSGLFRHITSLLK